MFFKTWQLTKLWQILMLMGKIHHILGHFIKAYTPDITSCISIGEVISTGLGTLVKASLIFNDFTLLDLFITYITFQIPGFLV